MITGLGITGAIYTAAGLANADGAAATIFWGAAVLCLVVAAIAAVTYRPASEVPDSHATEAALDGRAVGARLSTAAAGDSSGVKVND